MNKTINVSAQSLNILGKAQLNQIVGGGTANTSISSSTLNLNDQRSTDTGASGLDADINAQVL